MISTTTIYEAINNQRMSQNIPVVRYNSDLSEFAQRRADDMFNRNYFSHVTPEGQRFQSVIDFNRYKFNYAGENLAKDYKDVQSMTDAWLKSPLHRENLLSGKYRDIGIAIKGSYVVTLFGSQNRQPPVVVKTPIKEVVKPVVKPVIKQETKEVKKAEPKEPKKFIPIRMDNANSTIPTTIRKVKNVL